MEQRVLAMRAMLKTSVLGEYGAEAIHRSLVEVVAARLGARSGADPPRAGSARCGRLHAPSASAAAAQGVVPAGGLTN